MARFTPSMTRNHIRRSLIAIVDPLPSRAEVDALWSYFQHACAYCGKSLERLSRHGHLDHLVSGLSEGNSVFNHVLACATCDGDLKRKRPWLDFLSEVVADPQVRDSRASRIQAWTSRRPVSAVSQPDSTTVGEVIARALEAYDSSVAELLSIRAHKD